MKCGIKNSFFFHFDFLKKHWEFPALFLFITLVFRLPTFHGWDESFYFSQLFSVTCDRDFFLQNNLLHFPNAFKEKYRAITILDSDGALLNCFSIGPAFFYSPVVVSLLILKVPQNGIGLRIAIALYAVFMLTIVVFACFELLKELGIPPEISRLSVGTSLISTPFLIYATRLYLTSHFSGTVATTLMYLVWVKWLKTGRLTHIVSAGVFAGIMTIIRWQAVLLMIPMAVSSIPVLLGNLRKKCPALLMFGVLFTGTFMIQSLAWKYQFNTWFLIPQGSGFMKWFRPKLIPMLFSGFHGVLVWTPGLFLGLMGLFFSLKRIRDRSHKLFLIGMILTWPIVFYVTSCADDWWAGASYGQRRLTSLFPMVAVGLAGLLTYLRSRYRYILIICLMFWATLTAGAFRKNLDDLSLLILGKPSVSNPFYDQYAKYDLKDARALWIEGIRKMTTFGFTLTDTPDNTDRLIGCGIILIILILSRIVRNMLIVSTPLQNRILSAVIGWILISIAFMFFFIPDQNEWNRVWFDVVHQRELHFQHLPTSKPPREFWESAVVVRAVIACRNNDLPMFYKLLDWVKPRVDIPFKALIQFAQNADNRVFIDSPKVLYRHESDHF